MVMARYVCRYTGIKLDNLTAPYLSEEAKLARTRRRAVQLREALVSSGSVTFIKSGTHDQLEWQ